VLGLSNVTIGGRAIAQVLTPKKLCGLGLGPLPNALTIGGSSTITGTGCGLMSDNAVKFNSTANFSGSDWAVNSVTGCVASTGHCALSVPHNYNMLPATNPLKVLDGTEAFLGTGTPPQSFNTRTGNTNPSCPLQPDGWNHCTPNSTGSGAYGSFPNLTTGDKYILDPGTYFFYNASITINGTAQLKGTDVTLVLLGDSSSITMNGGTVNLSAPTTNTFSSALNGVLIDDQAQNANPNKIAVKLGGGTSSFGGAMYFRNAAVSWGGNVQSTNTTCTEVIANSLTINGNSYLSSNNCAPGTVATTQVVALVK